MNNHLVFTAVVHEEEGWFVADCPELGTVSQGHTFEDAVQNLREATDLYLEEFGAPTILPHKLIITMFEAVMPTHV